MDNRFVFKEYTNDIFIFNANELTIENKDYDFKLHFSFDWKDYRDHQEAIRDIIVKHLKLGTLDKYKYVKPNLVGDEYYKWLAGKINALHPYTGKVIYYELSPSQERFIRGDQVTIYIPDNFDRDNLAALCVEINDYMIKNGLKPGDKSDIAVNITPFINMRLEYIQDGENRVRIDALAMYDKNPQQRSQYSTYVLDNELFQFLSMQLNPNLTSQLPKEGSSQNTNLTYLGDTPKKANLDTTDKPVESNQENTHQTTTHKKKSKSFFARLFKKSEKQKSSNETVTKSKFKKN